jgi:hypothetical protein
MADDYNTHVLKLIQAHLEATVPAVIWEIEERGGITEADYERVRAYAIYIGSHGDAILYHVKGQTGPAMSKLVESIAVLSYCPGGITTFGLHFDGPEIARRLRQLSQGDQHTATA